MVMEPNYAILMVGSFIIGIGGGYDLMIAPICKSKVAPTSAHGFASFLEAFISFGILLGYISNFAFTNLSYHIV